MFWEKHGGVLGSWGDRTLRAWLRRRRGGGGGFFLWGRRFWTFLFSVLRTEDVFKGRLDYYEVVYHLMRI